ncbi:MAG TPA: DeoR/GlpR family DNA-binding transcription regulator [Mycobacteriales bacterium]|nr:DeoR/GlpR family DNA-binding transcription regulator [Mycobacteriales bacterium]
MRAERLNAVLDDLAQHGTVDVLALATRLGVSGATIRRDLRALHDQGLLVRTHGGAMTNDVGLELPIRYKASHHHPEKRRIGVRAAKLVTDGAVIGMTGGTTATEVARALPERQNVTVVTNALNIAAELVLRPNIRLLVAGGKARHASYELVGPTAEAMVSEYHFDITFIGVDGLTVAEGCTTHDEMEAHTDLAFIRQSRQNVVIADSSKIGKVTFARICDISAVSDLVTDGDIDPDALDALRQAGVTVTTA